MEEIDEWQEWIIKSEENREAARLASLEIIGFEFKEPSLPDIESEWKKLHQKTSGRNKTAVYGKRKADSFSQWFIKIAAIFIVAAITGLGVYLLSAGEDAQIVTEHVTELKTISTDGSEIKTVRFSNGSRIVLNRNTVMSYGVGNANNQTIEIILDGEAWFDVPEEVSDSVPAFEVRTPDGVIRDIGTQFLVTVKPGHTEVVLQKGIVEIDQIEAGNSSTDFVKDTFLLEKGELLAFNRTEILMREMVNPTFYTAWATNFMQFDRTSVHEFMQYVEQRFEVRGIITEPGIDDITIDGAVYFRSLAELVRAVSEVLEVPVFLSEKRDTVYIGRPY